MSEYIQQDKSKISCTHSRYKARNRLLRNHGIIPELHYYTGVEEALEASGLNEVSDLCGRVTVSDVKNASRKFMRVVEENEREIFGV